MKVLVLSDLHLGVPASSAPRWFASLRALCGQYDRVILNGDTLDRYEAPGCHVDCDGLLRQTHDCLSARRGPPEMVMGNHDPAVSTHQWLYLEESATLIFHGDCVADCTHPTRADEQLLAGRLARHWAQHGGRPKTFVELSDVYRRIQAQHIRENPLIRDPKTALTYLASAFLPPQKPFHILRYWRRAPRLAAELAATFDRPVRHVLIGHSHRPGRWALNGLVVMNTGSFMPGSRPYAAIIEDGVVALHPLRELARSARPSVD
jgi:predicted phosphodiesterase